MKQLSLNAKRILLVLLSVCFVLSFSAFAVRTIAKAEPLSLPEKIESFEIEGAQVRVDAEFGGMRFGSRVKKSDISVPTGHSLKFGTLIIPKKLLTSELTVDNTTDDIMNLVIENPVTVTESGVDYYSLRGVVSNIPEQYYKVEVLGRGYISVINDATNEVVKTYYTEALPRNIAYVAYKAQTVNSSLTESVKHYYNNVSFYEISVNGDATCEYDYGYEGQVLTVKADFDNIESIEINGGAVAFDSEKKTFVMPSEDVEITINDGALALNKINGADVSFLPDEAQEYLSKQTDAEVAEYLMNYHLNEWDKDNIPESAKPLTLSWFGGVTGSFTVTIATDSLFTNIVSEKVVDERSVDIYNLVPATYYWKVTDGQGNVSETDSFVVDDTIRTIYLDNIKNVRDLGGYTGEFGTLSYGKLYRSKDISNASEKAIDILVNQLGVKTEIDLRMDDNSGESPDASIEYVNTGFWQFDYLFPGLNENRPYNIVYTDALYNALKVVATANKSPVLFHCTAGADRTGTFAFLVSGLCGVSYEDLVKDFELTSFYSGRRWRSAIVNNDGVYSFTNSGVMLDDINDNLVSFGKMYNHIMTEYATSEGTLSSAIANYLYKVVNLSVEEIHAIRALLIDDYNAQSNSLDFLTERQNAVDLSKDLATQIDAWKLCGGEVTLGNSVVKNETKTNVLTFKSANKGLNENNHRYGDYFNMYNISIPKVIIDNAIEDGYKTLTFKYATKDSNTSGAVAHRFFVYDYVGKGAVNGSEGFYYRDTKETAATNWNTGTVELEKLVNGGLAFAAAGDTLYLAEVYFEGKPETFDITKDLSTQAVAWNSYDGTITTGASFTTKDGATKTALKFYTTTNTGVNTNGGKGDYYHLSSISIKAEVIAQAISEGYTTITFTFAAPNTPSGGVSNRVSWHNYKGTGTVNGAEANTANATGYISRKTGADAAWDTAVVNLSDLTNGTLAIAAAGDTLYLTNVMFSKGLDLTKDLSTQATVWNKYDGAFNTCGSFTTKDGATKTALKFYTTTNTGVNNSSGIGNYYFLSNISIKAEVIAQAISAGYTKITFTFAAPNTPAGGVSNRVSWHNYKGTGTVNGALANTANATGYISRKTGADAAWNTATVNLSDLTNGTLAIAAAGNTLYLAEVYFGK